MKILQQLGKRVVGYLAEGRQFVDPGRHMVAGAVHRVALDRQGHDLAKQIGIGHGCGAKRFEVARAGRFEVHQAAGVPGCNRIDAELVRSGMQAQLVGP